MGLSRQQPPAPPLQNHRCECARRDEVVGCIVMYYIFIGRTVQLANFPRRGALSTKEEEIDGQLRRPHIPDDTRKRFYILVKTVSEE